MAFPAYPNEVTLLDAVSDATSNGVELYVQDFGLVGVQLTAAASWDGTITFEGSVDGSTWGSLLGETLSDGALVTTATGTSLDDRYRFDLSGIKLFRTRVSGQSTGNITAKVRREQQGGGGNATVAQGTAADGAAVAGNPVLIAGTDGTNAQTFALNSSGTVAVLADAAGATDGFANTGVEFFVNSSGGNGIGQVAPVLFNGSTWDRTRNNEEITILASAARTATTDSADLVNYNAKGVMIILDITVDAVSVGLTLSILMKDPVSAKDVTIWTAAAAATGVGTDVYLIYPGVLAADFNGSEAVSMALPRTWVLRVTTADADEATYSIGASYIN